MSIESTNTQFKAVITNKTGLQSTAVSNGCVYFVDDTKELFFDFDSTRVEVKDILILNTDAQRTNILFNPLNKFYFVLETQKLWLYRNGVWYEISGSVDLSNYYTKTEVNELIPEVPTNLSDFIDDLGDNPTHTHNQYLTEHQNISGKADKSTTLSGYGITDAYTKTEVDSKLSAVYKFKGTVESIDSLPSSGNTVGDVYNVEDTGANYAWTGTGWDKLSETVDLSGLEQTSNKVTSLSASSTDTQYPSAKCVYDVIQASGGVVDNALSTTSENPVQNKVITGALNDKQDVILDLSTIRSGASAGSTAVQPNDLATVATSGSYNDLSDKPTIPAAQVQANWNETDTSSKAYIQNKPTIPSTSNFVTTNTAQNITGEKTFVGDKRLFKFKQNSSTTKLGFTLYNRSDTEVGGLEYNPSSNILALNAPMTGSNTLLGFRYWGAPASNIIIPKPTSGDYYIPLSFKNGSSTVTTNSSGVADLSNLIPTIATSVSASSTNNETVGAKLFYDTIGDIETLLSEV